MTYPYRTVRVGDVDVPLYSRGAAVISLLRGIRSLAVFIARYFRQKGNHVMFGTYASSTRPRLVWSNPNFVRKGRSIARLTVIEGGKGKPAVSTPAITALPRQEQRLALPAPSAPSTPAVRPQPRPGLPPYVDPDTYW